MPMILLAQIFSLRRANITRHFNNVDLFNDGALSLSYTTARDPQQFQVRARAVEREKLLSSE